MRSQYPWVRREAAVVVVTVAVIGHVEITAIIDRSVANKGQSGDIGASVDPIAEYSGRIAAEGA